VTNCIDAGAGGDGAETSGCGGKIVAKARRGASSGFCRFGERQLREFESVTNAEVAVTGGEKTCGEMQLFLKTTRCVRTRGSRKP